MSDTFEPKIVGIFCNWCTYMAADLAGISRMRYAPNVRIIRVMCSGRVEPQHILWAFHNGADGVLIGGCNPGDCHYQEGNYKALRRITMLKNMLPQLGIESDRLRLEWISAAQADKLRTVADEFSEHLRKLGPLPQPIWSAELEADLSEIGIEHEVETPATTGEEVKEHVKA